MLLVPPLAAPAFCFDLRRGCSLAEHLLLAGRDIYLVDYGEIEFGDRALGLEHWIEDVIPKAVRAASEDAGGRPVRLIGWSLGGIMALLAHAADTALPIEAIALVGSPWDFTRVPMIAPLRPIAAVTRGRGITELYRAARRRSRAAGARRLPAARDREVPDEAVDDRHQPRRPRPDGADRGGRPLHGAHARLPGAHLRPALPPLLPHQRPRAGPAGADRAHGRPRRGVRPAAVGRRARRRDRARRGLPPPRRAGARRPVAATGDGARRPPRRAHGPRGARHDLGADRRVARRRPLQRGSRRSAG